MHLHGKLLEHLKKLQFDDRKLQKFVFIMFHSLTARLYMRHKEQHKTLPIIEEDIDYEEVRLQRLRLCS